MRICSLGTPSGLKCSFNRKRVQLVFDEWGSLKHVLFFPSYPLILYLSGFWLKRKIFSVFLFGVLIAFESGL